MTGATTFCREFLVSQQHQAGTPTLFLSVVVAAAADGEAMAPMGACGAVAHRFEGFGLVRVCTLRLPFFLGDARLAAGLQEGVTGADEGRRKTVRCLLDAAAALDADLGVLGEPTSWTHMGHVTTAPRKNKMQELLPMHELSQSTATHVQTRSRTC